MTDRWDETFHRLQAWTNGQGPSERLAAQVLYAHGFEDLDPSHPLGGKDGGRDAEATRDGNRWIMAVYFPRGQQSFAEIKAKFKGDLDSARVHKPHGLAFVTNQELRKAERSQLEALGEGIEVILFHVERIVGILDRPDMSAVRQQFLAISPDRPAIAIDLEITGSAQYFEDGADLRDIWLQAGSERAEAAASQPAPSSFPLAARFMWDSDRQQLSASEVEQWIDRWKSEIRANWSKYEDHLAETGLRPLGFRLINRSQAFLQDVEVIITIQGARAVHWLGPEYFDDDKLFAPVFPPQSSYVAGIDPAEMAKVRLKDYPTSFKSRHDTVTVTIDLPRLRPHPAWENEQDDLVLLAVDREAAEIVAQWTATAQGYGEHYEGDPVRIPVQAISVADALHVVGADQE